MSSSGVAHMIWSAAGRPAGDGLEHGVCRSCGCTGTGLPFDSWVRDTFTDWDKLRPGELVCHACQFCFTDRNDALTRLTGKDKPQRMRNYSHFVVGGKWMPLSKGDKRKMRKLLSSSPGVAIVAESGQKHIIFRAKPGWWQFEEQSLLPFPAELADLLDPVERLYAGFSKAEIETGRYAQHRVLKFGVAEWGPLEAQIRPVRGTARLALALFLAQREEED
jgi:hypothetical protein